MFFISHEIAFAFRASEGRFFVFFVSLPHMYGSARPRYVYESGGRGQRNAVGCIHVLHLFVCRACWVFQALSIGSRRLRRGTPQAHPVIFYPFSSLLIYVLASHSAVPSVHERLRLRGRSDDDVFSSYVKVLHQSVSREVGGVDMTRSMCIRYDSHLKGFLFFLPCCLFSSTINRVFIRRGVK